MRTHRFSIAGCLLALGAVIPAVRANTILVSTTADWTVQGQFNTDLSATPYTSGLFDGATTYTGAGSLTAGNNYAASFGNQTYPGYSTYWAPNTTLHLETHVHLSGSDLSSIVYTAAIDNDYELFVNGSLVNTIYHDGFASYSAPAVLTNLHAGVNTIDVVAEDRGGGTFFDMQVSGANDTAAVPDAGSSAWLLMAGLTGLLLALPATPLGRSKVRT